MVGAPHSFDAIAPHGAAAAWPAMGTVSTVIRIHAEAPAKPAWGQPCNGCGVCCLSEPCPAGVWVSRRRQGACTAVRWDASGHRYRCGLVDAARPWLGAVVRRWIAAGRGCDSDAQAF
jgi:hypothetical protein